MLLYLPTVEIVHAHGRYSIDNLIRIRIFSHKCVRAGGQVSCYLITQFVIKDYLMRRNGLPHTLHVYEWRHKFLGIIV